MKKTIKHSCFNEWYQVKIRYAAIDGFWNQKELSIPIQVRHGVNEKNNHNKARSKAKELYPDCEIVSVKYC